MTNWYDTGYEHAEKIQAEMDARKRDGFGPRRFWVPADGTKKEIIFIGGVLDGDGEITSNPFCVYEHNLQINGRWGNHLTCMKKRGQECAACDIGDKPAYTAFFTVIECTEYTDKKGVTHVNETRLLPAKAATRNLLKTLSDNLPGKSLVGYKFQVSRSTNKSASVGDIWVPLGPVPEDQVLAMVDTNGNNCSFDPIDYVKWLAPKTYEEQKAFVGTASSNTESFAPPAGDASFESTY